MCLFSCDDNQAHMRDSSDEQSREDNYTSGKPHSTMITTTTTTTTAKTTYRSADDEMMHNVFVIVCFCPAHDDIYWFGIVRSLYLIIIEWLTFVGCCWIRIESDEKGHTLE